MLGGKALSGKLIQWKKQQKLLYLDCDLDTKASDNNET